MTDRASLPVKQRTSALGAVAKDEPDTIEGTGTDNRGNVPATAARTGRKYDMAVLRNAARWNRSRSTNPLQRTPDALFSQLDEEFHFTLDAASSDHNAKCGKHYTEVNAGLQQEWSPEIVWCNPPYGRSIGPWVEKGYREAGKGATVVMLVPSGTDLPWWHEFAMHADEIRFIRGRVQFERENGEIRYGTKYQNSFFASAVLVFRGQVTDGQVTRD